MTTNLQLARQVSRAVQIENVVLRRAEVEAFFEPNALPPELALVNGFRSEYQVHRSEDSQKLSVIVDFKFEAREAVSDEPGEVVADLSATFHLLYSLPLEFEADENCFEHFASVNGVYNAWPYWRELVQTSTGRIGLPGVVLPVFRPASREVESADCSKDNEALSSENGNRL